MYAISCIWTRQSDVSLPHGVMSKSAVCDCGISCYILTYVLAIIIQLSFMIKY